MKTLKNRKLYIPQMSYEGAVLMAGAFQSVGIDADPSPFSDQDTLVLAKKYLSGDECLPQAIVLGNFLKVTQQPDYDPEKTAFMLPTSNGPCRYGQYLQLVQKVFQDRGEDVFICSPTSTDGYAGIGEGALDFVRTAWRAVVASDCVRKMLLITRPYEINPGDTDKVYECWLPRVRAAFAQQEVSHKQRLKDVVHVLQQMQSAFHQISLDRSREKVIIGVVGEIYCRHNNYSNNDLFRMIEKHDGIVWISDIAEWVWYTNDEQIERLKQFKKRLSFEMFGAKIRHAVMKSDEHKILGVFKKDFVDFPEPTHIRQVLNMAERYMPRDGSNGEMVMSTGKSLWYHQKGAHGIIDISPFTCMNGIITEAIYPRMSRDLNNMPVRVFYFDGIQPNLDMDLEIFMELAKNYRGRDKQKCPE